MRGGCPQAHSCTATVESLPVPGGAVGCASELAVRRSALSQQQDEVALRAVAQPLTIGSKMTQGCGRPSAGKDLPYHAGCRGGVAGSL